jgi:hypothetical protein
LFVFSIFSDVFLNSYLIIKNNYESRLISSYGFCDKQGYGYIKKIKKNFNPSNVTLINYSNDFPLGEKLFLSINNDNKEMNNVIIINKHLKKTKNNFDNYQLIDQFQNCEYLQK